MMYFSISIHKGPTMTMIVVIRYAGGGTGQAKREEGLVRRPPQFNLIFIYFYTKGTQ